MTTTTMTVLYKIFCVRVLSAVECCGSHPVLTTVRPDFTKISKQQLNYLLIEFLFTEQDFYKSYAALDIEHYHTYY